MRGGLPEQWHVFCNQAHTLKRIYQCLSRKAPREVLISAWLVLGVVTLLLVPARRSAPEFGSAARVLFTMTEADYLSPLLSSAKTVTILNCAAQNVATFAGYDEFSSRINIGGKADVVNVTRYSGSLLSLLNIRYALVVPADLRGGFIYIGESFWKRAFDRRDDVLGASLDLHGKSYRIAGVIRNRSDLLAATDIWLPVSGRGSHGVIPSMRILGALRPGIHWSTAQNELTKCFDELLKDQCYNAAPGARLIPLDTAVSFRESAPALVTVVDLRARQALKT